MSSLCLSLSSSSSRSLALLSCFSAKARSLRSQHGKKRKPNQNTPHRPERLWRVTPLKTDVRDAGPLEFFFSSAVPLAPPDDVAADDVSTIFFGARGEELGRKVRGVLVAGRSSEAFGWASPPAPNEVSFVEESRGVFFQRRFQPRNVRSFAFTVRGSPGASVISSDARRVARGKRVQGVEARTRCCSDVAGAAAEKNVAISFFLFSWW